jgi:hypothetical protein
MHAPDRRGAALVPIAHSGAVPMVFRVINGSEIGCHRKAEGLACYTVA